LAQQLNSDLEERNQRCGHAKQVHVKQGSASASTQLEFLYRPVDGRPNHAHRIPSTELYPNGAAHLSIFAQGLGTRFQAKAPERCTPGGSVFAEAPAK
jgi:hypothetical protein